VDHKTESDVNAACQPQEKVTHDLADTLVAMLMFFLALGQVPLMWKRDISQAFRRVAIAAEHLDLSWVVFVHRGLHFVAQHIGMPFGTVSAVYAWHRVGAMLLAVLRRICKAPAARYVDDYFGCSKKGVYWTGGRCLTVFGDLLGFPCQPGKNADDLLCMIVLGARVGVELATARVTASIDPEKGLKWTLVLLEILRTQKCDPELAAKMAGRLSFAVSAAAGKVGRAYLKPFFAQAYAPLLGSKASWWLFRAATWWIRYLASEPAMAHDAAYLSRPRVCIWTDAAGASRWIAAVARTATQWLWTRMLVPAEVWNQFLPRRDDQIGMQELLALPLALESFRPHLRGALVTIAVDNQGVLNAVLQGRAGADDLNAVVGKLWLEIAAESIAMHVVRVESLANIADGPTRESTELLDELGAVFVTPVLPDWARDVWSMPA